ncbi:UNVERIFIED_CONTAM: class II heat shock protein [Sesamum radiatum]|uniref:Class II heat shock protein n=1 Tax=Sesamum radiatum TaxID=300843 RepID=A0AAW2MIY7_SESRA
MDLRNFGLDTSLLSTLQDMLDFAEDHEKPTQNNPSKAYIRDAKAMAATPADVKEYPSSYVFIVDMPGIGAGDIKVQLEEDNVLVVSGERKEGEGGGSEVSEDGTTLGEVHEEVCIAGERKHGGHIRSVPRRRAGCDGAEAASTRAKEAQDH